LLNTAGIALAVEPSGWKGWEPYTWGAGTMARLSWTTDAVEFNFGAGVRYDTITGTGGKLRQATWTTVPLLPTLANGIGTWDDEDRDFTASDTRVPFHAGLRIPLSDAQGIRAAFDTDLSAIGTPYGWDGKVHASWYQTIGDRGRVALGVDALIPGELPTMRDDELDGTVSLSEQNAGWDGWPVLPLPHVRLWWAL
jgi:hypothetical protein